MNISPHPTSAPDLSHHLKWLDTATKEEAQTCCTEMSAVAHALARESAAAAALVSAHGPTSGPSAYSAPAAPQVLLGHRDALAAVAQQVAQLNGDADFALEAVREMAAVTTFKDVHRMLLNSMALQRSLLAEDAPGAPIGRSSSGWFSGSSRVTPASPTAPPDRRPT
eukprot:TRINITY_DN7013_c0_g1_i1.p2 TRINITY_DN7013_c0_g1~~TRINITY_DN7013_c0_g1_i1.p2  ORF type:complete len:181 (+),score=47.28 TRINITY_DN7013_c0_g1_i1:44-544(+)